MDCLRVCCCLLFYVGGFACWFGLGGFVCLSSFGGWVYVDCGLVDGWMACMAGVGVGRVWFCIYGLLFWRNFLWLTCALVGGWIWCCLSCLVLGCGFGYLVGAVT